jgi:RNA polymerase sigma-70 factor, ECF subfamily
MHKGAHSPKSRFLPSPSTPPGNFSSFRGITHSDGLKRGLLARGPATFVLSSEAHKRSAMNDTHTLFESQNQPGRESDEQLMLAFSKGSQEAFTELFQRYKQPLFGFFRRRVADPTLAEELTQEAFLAILLAGSRYQPRALFRTYLYAVAFKILRASRRKTAFRAAFLGVPGKREASVQSTSDAELSLRHALGKLDRIDREILLLREFEELSYAEIADVLNLPLNTVRSRLFRARVALRELLSAPAKAVNTKFQESEEHA